MGVAKNGAAIIASFGNSYLSQMTNGILVFLDVEGPPHPSLSASYYLGWSQGLVAAGQSEMVEVTSGQQPIQFIPCAYLDNLARPRLTRLLFGMRTRALVWDLFSQEV